MNKTNKLSLVDDIKIKTGIYDITSKNNNTAYIIGQVSLLEYDLDNYNLNLIIEDNTTLKYDKVSIIKKDLNLSFTVNSDSKVTFNYLIINEGINNCIIKVNMLGNRSSANINIHVVNKNASSSANVVCEGLINSNTANNELLEDLKGLLTNKSVIKISPNMFVKTSEVLANHKVTISSYNLQELFYLTTHGLNLKTAQELLLESFTVKFMPNIFQDKIKMEVINNE